MSGGGKRKYGRLSLQKKIEIIKAAEKGFSQRALASRYNCGKTQIHLLVTQKAMWLDKWARAQNGRNHDDTHSFTDEQVSSFNNFNDLVYDFYAKLSSTGVPVSGTMLLERASQVAKELCLQEFVVDHDWLDAFVSHCDIALSEDDDNSLTLLRGIGSRVKDSALVQNFDLCDIYNLGEVRLPYKFLPSDCDLTKPCTIKDYLTVSLCFNAVGGKEAELIIYDSSLHGEVSSDMHSQCVSNWRGVMTQSLYVKRLTQLNAEMARQSRHVLLLVDESKYSGTLECTLSNVKVKPTLSCLQSQPLLCSLGHIFKFLYCRRLLRMLLAHRTPESPAVDLAGKLPLSKAVSLIQGSWDDLQLKTIQNSFFEAGLKHFRGDNEDVNQVLESNEALILEIKNLVGLMHDQANGEEISDEIFTVLVEENICSTSTSECSDIEDETISQGLSKDCHVNTLREPQAEKPLSCFSLNQASAINESDVSSLVSEALPSISKLNKLADVICNKNQIHRTKLLLNELESLFEDAIADFKFQTVSETLD